MQLASPERVAVVRQMSPPTHPTLVIENTRKAERLDDIVGQRTHELRARMRAINTSSHSLKRDKQFLELIESTERKTNIILSSKY